MPKKVQNIYTIKDNYVECLIIRTDNSQVITLFSLEDYEFLKKCTVSFKIDNKNGDYRIKFTAPVEIQGKDVSTYLLYDGNPENMVDHINRNTLDNRRENLRLVTRSINATNAKPRTESKTNIRGIYFRKARPGIVKAAWICEWSINKHRYTKSFSIDKYGEEEAFNMACELRKQKLEEMKIQSNLI